MFSKLNLDRVAAIVMIATSAVLLAKALAIRTTAVGPTTSPALYVAGDTFAQIPGLDLNRASRTLILFLRSGCRYCTASAGFYQRVLATPSRVPVVAIGFEEREGLDGYLRLHGVRPDMVLSLPADSRLKLGPTPMILLVTSAGRVAKVWRGQLRSEREENEVIRAISGSYAPQ